MNKEVVYMFLITQLLILEKYIWYFQTHHMMIVMIDLENHFNTVFGKYRNNNGKI